MTTEPTLPTRLRPGWFNWCLAARYQGCQPCPGRHIRSIVTSLPLIFSSNAVVASGNSPSPERPYMEARMREMVAPIIAVTMVDFEDGDSGGGGDATRRSSRSSKKASVESPPPGSMLQVGRTGLAQEMHITLESGWQANAPLITLELSVCAAAIRSGAPEERSLHVVGLERVPAEDEQHLVSAQHPFVAADFKRRRGIPDIRKVRQRS